MKKLLPVVLLLAAACGKDLVCPGGETACSGHCVSLQTDPVNCGSCGATVGALETCVGGAAVCSAGIGLCGSTCTDFARDPNNCGACGAACTSDQLCATGVCSSSCPGGFTVCSRACVDLLSDAYNCGACRHACPGGEVCVAGACRPDLVVACGSTDEVVPVTAALTPAGSSRATPAGPTAIAVHGGSVYSANGYPSASVSVLPFDLALPTRDVTVPGSDLEHVAIVGDVVVVSNAAIGSLVFFSLAGDKLGELAMPNQQYYPNPHGLAVSGSAAYVALYGSGSTNDGGQGVAKIDLSALATCAASPTAAGCGTTAGTSILGTIDLKSVAGASDAPGLPFPSQALATGGKVYVSLANLKQATFSCGTACTYTAWAEPAGHGKLAVIDPASADAVSIVDLGSGCGNPSAMDVLGTTLWVACGSWSFPVEAPGVLVPVDLTQSPPTVGATLALSPTLPGSLAFCGGVGYATDQASGAVVRFDPTSRTVEKPVAICAMGPYGYAWASDVACGH